MLVYNTGAENKKEFSLIWFYLVLRVELCSPLPNNKKFLR